MLDCSGGALSVRCGDGNVLVSTTGSAFRRWALSEDDFIVLDPAGRIVQRTGGLGPSGTPIHLAIYSAFAQCGAIIHSHAPYTLAFAAMNRPIPSATNLMDTLGAVPCLVADDKAIKSQWHSGHGNALAVPEGMVQRPDVAAINIQHLIPQLLELFTPRMDELSIHGLAFTIYRHGIVVFARSLAEAFDNLVRVETSARTALLSTLTTLKR